MSSYLVLRSKRSPGNRINIVSLECRLSTTTLSSNKYKHFNNMPLFGSKRQQPSPTRDTRYADEEINDTPNRKDSIFSRHRGPSRDKRSSLDDSSTRARDREINNNNGNNTGTTGGGLFTRSRGRSSMDDSDADRMSHSSSGSRLTRSGNGKVSNDPAISSARQKVSDAEEAERQADRALIDSRNAVKEARQHVKELEREVEMEARMAKLKQQEAKDVSKSAKGLGRHM